MPTVVATGSLTPVTLPRLLGRLYRERFTGGLHVEHGGVSRAWLREGLLVGSNAFTRFRPLGQGLLERGAIDIETLGRSLADMAQTKRLQGEILMEMGAVTHEELLHELKRQHLENTAELLRVDSGTFRLETEVELPGWTRDVAISPHEAVLALLREPGQSGRVERLLGLLGERPVQLQPAWGEEWPRFQMSKAEFREVQRFESPTPVTTILSDTDVDGAGLAALLATLACFRLLG